MLRAAVGRKTWLDIVAAWRYTSMSLHLRRAMHDTAATRGIAAHASLPGELDAPNQFYLPHA